MKSKHQMIKILSYQWFYTTLIFTAYCMRIQIINYNPQHPSNLLRTVWPAWTANTTPFSIKTLYLRDVASMKSKHQMIKILSYQWFYTTLIFTAYCMRIQVVNHNPQHSSNSLHTARPAWTANNTLFQLKHFTLEMLPLWSLNTKWSKFNHSNGFIPL